MPDFVDRHSIVRSIWGDSDTVLLIFAGSSAEFALNRAVDWLFFTGRLPADPIGRLFSTVRYAQDIVFSDYEKASRTVGRMAAIHGGVEKQRGYSIPDWAYRDVLYMLIDYSERAYELMYRPLTNSEREEVFQVFRKVGEGMHVPELPANYAEWKEDRKRHLDRDLVRSEHTDQLFTRYREELGKWRYDLLLQAQAQLVPDQVRQLLHMEPSPGFASAVWMYRLLNRLKLKPLLQRVLLPARYLEDIRQFEKTAA
jgi:uncharacterized protein (DUF2236 family)